MDLREVVWVGIDLVPIKWVTSHCESASWSNSDHGAGRGGGGWRNRSPASARRVLVLTAELLVVLAAVPGRH